MHRIVVALLALVATAHLTGLQAAQINAITNGSTWRYFIGTQEASTPSTAWRALSFNDTSWSTGPAPLGYAIPPNDPGGLEATIRTTLSPSAAANYLTVFLRRTFVVSSPADVGVLNLIVRADDGYIAWINGTEVKRFNVPPAGELTFADAALVAGEPSEDTLLITSGLGSLLVPGTNILAIQLFNQALASPDLFLDASLGLLVDDVRPVVLNLFPPAGATVRELTEVQVRFSEDVTGVDATDLLINGAPATNALALSPADYSFQFAQPPTGTVQVAWAPGQDIRDLAATPNTFAGGNWTYLLNPNLPAPALVINEFLASNSGSLTNSIRDEDGDDSDWIEIYNGGGTLANLDGWFLTDDAAQLTKWRFPNATIAGQGYLIVFASGKDRTNIFGRLHTSFQLSAGGEYLALVNPQTNVVSEFVPSFPPQQTDISYGRDRVDLNLLNYFLTPTPGGPNVAGGTGVAPEVQFSRRGGAFLNPFSLVLSTSSSNAVIRYVLGTNAATANPTNFPTANSPIYTDPIPISASVQVRARTFQTGLLPGPLRSESYLLLATNHLNWSSDLPVVILHSLGNGNISAGAGAPDTFANCTVIEPDLTTGRTRLTNEAAVSTRSGINLRGSSTQGLSKRNLAVEFWDEANADLELEVLGLPAESDWVLYPPNGFDHPLIHNPFIYEVSRNVGRYASRTRFVELFYKINAGPINTNADYFGVYVFTEKIKIDNNRVEIPNLAPEETNAPAVTGGYLFLINSGRVDSNERAFFVNATGQQGGAQEVIFQDPEGPDIRTAQRRPQEIYITNYLGQFAAALASSSYTNPTTGYAAYIDVGSWIDHHILNVVGRNVDAIRLSGYFHKDRNKKIEFGPIWDFDRAMGTGKPSEADIGYRSYNPREWLNQASGDRGTDFFRYATHRWWGRLFEDVDFWQRYIDRWQELRRTHLTTNSLFVIVDRMAAEISEAQRRDQLRWSTESGAGNTSPRNGTITANGYTHTFDGTYAGEITFLKRWLRERLDFVDTNFLAAPQLNLAEGQVTSGVMVALADVSGKAGTTLYYTLDGTDPRLPAGAISPAARVYSGPITITNNVRIFARALNPNHRNVLNSNCPFGGCPPISTPWSGPAEATYHLSIPGLRITEIMYHPQDPPSGNTNDSNGFEYIELKNIGSTSINLNHARLRGGIEFDFESLLLPAGSNVVVVANRAAFESRYGTNKVLIAGVYSNSLANEGEQIILQGPAREPILDFSYSDQWYPITDGFGFSLVIADENAPLSAWGLKESWRPSSGLNGSPGANDAPPPNIPPVVINEVLTHTDPPPPYDSIELRNLSGSPANVGGWFLTDELDKPKKYRIPNGTTITGNGFMVFDETQFNFNNPDDSFSLDSLGDEVYLFSGDANTNLTGYLHGFDFGAAKNGGTFGRYVISTGDDQFPPQTSPTLTLANAGPLIGPVVISEIMYHPPDLGFGNVRANNTMDEFIELHNFGSTPAPLYDPAHPTNTWQLRNAVDFDFPPNVTLPPGGYLLVASFNPADAAKLADFRARNGVPASVPVYGPMQGNLDNIGERVELRRPDVPEPAGPPFFSLVPSLLVEAVRYSDFAPWPIAAGGIGPSLHRTVPSAYGNDPTNWVAAARTPGTGYGGGAPPAVTQQPTNRTVIAFMNASFNVTASGAGPFSYQWLFNGSLVLGATNSTLLLTNVQAAQGGQYQVVVMNPANSVASSNATLTVLIPANITSHPMNRAVLLGSNATFSVAATSTTPIQYQWRKNGINIPGATSATLTLNNVQESDDAFYDVVLTDAIGPVVSQSARLLVLVNPQVVEPLLPINLTVVQGGEVTFSARATGTVPMSFRWRRGGTTLTNDYPNTTRSSFFTLRNAQPGNSNVSLVITNSANIPGSGLLTNLFILTVLADTDMDGIPDEFETPQNGLDPNNPADAGLDSDNDTLTNLEEYIAGTDHRDAQSYLKVDGIALANGGLAAQLTFLAVSNRTYSVQYRTNAAAGAWQKLVDVVLSPSNRVVQVTDPAPGTGEVKRTYRLATPPQP